jgi:hypothetical protein
MMYESIDVTFRESESYFSSAGVFAGSSIVLNDLLDIVPIAYVNATSETSREGGTDEAKEREGVEECELIDTKGEQKEPLVVIDPVDSSTDSGIIPLFAKHYV